MDSLTTVEIRETMTMDCLLAEIRNHAPGGRRGSAGRNVTNALSFYNM